jgi:competence protein ComEA
MTRIQGMALGLVVSAIVLGAGLGTMGGQSTATGTLPSTAPDEADAGSRLVVYVSGWVSTPGVVEVEEGAIVADAIAAAGGAVQGALLDAVNLARPLTEGEHVQIPGPGDSSPVGSVASGDSADGLIPINQADASALEELPGVGPVLAERIVAHREDHGPFEVVEDLLEVPGIGEAKLASMRDLIKVP